jgi:glycine/D-amino acid oxidase-like deaminating enzyme
VKTRQRLIASSVLVIGAGRSGLRAAIELAERDSDVLVVSKRPSCRPATRSRWPATPSSAQPEAQHRSANALAAARAEVDQRLAADGRENARWSQRALMRDVSSTGTLVE